MDAEEVIKELTEKVDPSKLKTMNNSTGITLRERWRRTMYFQKVANIPNLEFGYWDSTLKNWHKEGLPPEVNNEESAYEYFGIENWKKAPVNTMGLYPSFPYITLSEDEETRTYQDDAGAIAQINIKGDKSIPHYIDFKLKDRKSWQEYKEKLVYQHERIPANWNELVESYNKRDYPLAVSRGSLIGSIRNWMGFEGVALMVYDDPALLEEMVETVCNMICDTLEIVLKDVEFDFAAGWEDICFNSGPIVGVDFMENVVSPRYRRISDILEKHGCHVSWTDCDGNIMPIVNSFLNGGINCMFPVEVNGGSDPLELRKKWPGIKLQGGFCKMKLLAGKDAIKKEIQRLSPIVKEGGFLPGVDHRVQADVKLENYKYYLKMKREFFGVGGTPQYKE